MTLTRAQFATYAARVGAVYHSTKGGAEWWRLPDGRWLGAREVRTGYVEVKQFEAGACSC